jgi:hypothetical protein
MGSPSRRPWLASGRRWPQQFGLAAGVAALALLASATAAADLQLLRAAPDPYGYPRPAPGAKNVPPGTSLYFEIGFQDKDSEDAVVPASVAVRMRPQGGPDVELLRTSQRFADGCSGKFFPGAKGKALAVYIDRQLELAPATTYVVSVTARSRQGRELNAEQGTWQFTTADAAAAHAVRFALDVAAPAVRWHGGFFTGFCKPSFCTSAANRIPGYKLMNRVRSQSPKAWSLQRDFWLTGMEHQPAFPSPNLPNVVRERETRRIAAIEEHGRGTLLRLEDFFGHEQYGIAAGRPLTRDYHPGDEVLVADGIRHAEAKVLEVVADTAEARSLLVTRVEEPPGGWRIHYAGPLPRQEDRRAPGLFPPGGCYLRKLRPAGTPEYCWKRVDAEFDIAHRRFGRRLVVNFTDAPGDLSVDGQNWTYPKDYAEYHDVVRAFTDHLLERYGDGCREFVWSVLNEPDLSVLFWRSRDWKELQRFYDYTVDAVLRAFEDRGYDSDRVFVGGLEIGAIFGIHIEQPVLQDFLCHCSPKATSAGALPQNAAFADRRLDGQRSRRVEKLCRGAGGKGSPCDFVSVHSYNAAPVTAAKLIRAKELALATDAEYYARLWVNCFESCPGWAPPRDVAASDSYLGNGYFPTWCADVARRQLAKAAADARYAFGESLLTFWPWPNSNFGGHNDATRVIAVDQDGDGQKDREETVAMPILNFLGLLAGMGENYWVLPEQTIGSHAVSGFAARGEKQVQLLLYSHDPQDTQSRSAATFEIELALRGITWPEVSVREYRFDKDHNSYYHLGRELRDRPAGATGRAPRPEEVERLIADLTGGDRAVQIAAVKKAATFGELPEALLAAAFQLYQETKDDAVRQALAEAGRQMLSRQVCYRPAEVARVRELSVLRVTNQRRVGAGPDRVLRLPFAVAANGANFVAIEPADKPSTAAAVKGKSHE